MLSRAVKKKNKTVACQAAWWLAAGVRSGVRPLELCVVTSPTRRGGPGLMPACWGPRPSRAAVAGTPARRVGRAVGRAPSATHQPPVCLWLVPGSSLLSLPPSLRTARGCPPPLSRGLAGSAGSGFQHPPPLPGCVTSGTPLHSSELWAPHAQRPGLLYVPILRCWGPMFCVVFFLLHLEPVYFCQPSFNPRGGHSFPFHRRVH